MKCPDHSRELISTPDGTSRCPMCDGQLMTVEQLDAKVPEASLWLVPEVKPLPRRRRCPHCASPLVPLRIGTGAAWVEQCESSGLLWVEKGHLRTLGMLTRSAARKAAYASLSATERQALTNDLAEAVHESQPVPVSLEHKALAGLGLPALHRTDGANTPWVSWGLSALLIAVQLFTEPESLAYLTGSGSMLGLLTAGFAHFGWAHLIGNVIFLLIFGASAERKVARWLFATTLVVLTPLTIAAEALASPDGVLVGGASGFVAACIGISMIVQRRAQVTLWLFSMVTMPLWVYGAGWVVFQLVSWSMGLGGVAWAAHVFGFGVGLGIGALAKKGSAG